MSFLGNSSVLKTVLTGLDTSVATAITAVDSILSAFGKLMALINTKADASAIVTINGTAGEVNVDQTDPQNITLSTPQAIATTSNVTFNNGSFTGLLKGLGTNDGSEPAAGYQGEFAQYIQPSGTAVAITSGTAVDIISGTFTKGRWLIFHEVTFNPGGQTLTAMITAASVVANTLPGNDYYISGDVRTATVPASNPHIVGFRYINLSVDTTLHLVAQIVSGGAGVTGYGALWGIRLP